MHALLVEILTNDKLFMSWCFAIVNGRLTELYFEKTKGKRTRILGHCYVKKEEFSTKQEKRWIAKDIKRYQFSYKNDRYRDKLNN